MRILTADECPQGSPEWWDARRGLPTASSFDRIMTPARRKFSAQAAGYAAELAADVADLRPDWFSERTNKPPKPWMEHGQEVEPEARRWYEMETASVVRQVGFCRSACGCFGCSPDGLVYGVTPDGAERLEHGLELKCPLLKTQAAYLLKGELPLEYQCQVHGSLIVSGLRRWDFLSYAPGLPALHLPVERNDFTDALEEMIYLFLKVYDATLQRLLGSTLDEMIARLHPG